MNAPVAGPPMETLRALMAEEVTHVVGLPDNTLGPLFDLLLGHETVTLVTVTREGEAFAVASGLWLGGASPLVAIQNTGLLEAGDSLRGTALRMAAPIPMIVSGRGYAKMRRADLTPDVDRTLELLTRADVDSAALFTEPTLDAWGVPYLRCEGGTDPAAAIVETIRAARKHERPTAVVLARALT